jgi:hypothetical protein
MATGKTMPTAVPVEAFIAGLGSAQRRAEAQRLDALFREASGFMPRMWGPSIIGYGRYAYRYASGHEGEAAATGFSPRKAHLVAYIMPGYADFGPILARLGPHRLGKSCLYLTRLDRIDLTALAELIRAGLVDLAKHWPVEPA